MPVPAAEGHQERQLIAGRYRLASFHRGDERTEVWRALDESLGHVVTLEFLRDREPANRERFVGEARRLGMQRPTVMRVAGVYDGADGTFIVFEDLVQALAALDAQKPAAEVPAALAKASEPPAVALPKVEPPKVEPPKVELAAVTPAKPILSVAAAPEVATPDVSSDASSDQGMATLVAALRARKLSLPDTTLLMESVVEIAEDVRSFIEELHLEDIRIVAAVRSSLEDLHLEDIRMDEVVAEARALLSRVDLSVLRSAFTHATVAAGGLASIRPEVHVPAPPRVHLPSPPRIHVPAPRVPRPPRVHTARVKVAAPAKPAVPHAPKARRAVRPVRWGRVLSRGLTLGVLAAVVISMPPELTAKIEDEVRSTLDQMSRALAPSEPGLARASFELPPLSAYGATFESQSPYPTASPNGTVEWVVALRNTGSVGWYRGIDGAQASLALVDGTSAGVQSTPYVGPGQVGWFVVHFPAPPEPGTYRVSFLPRIDGRGALPDLGINATVTVSTNP
ncbi:MAG: hypothetical protein E6H91_06145 [Chloroflexi bacterium]|nr:MAG: hypothetical protein E6H91_06145 [Chloroflexota bacterium]